MKPKTVTTGHVRTRVCRRGSPNHHLTAPAGESLLHVACAMKEIVKALSKGPGPCERLDRVAQRHLLEREKQVRARFDRDRLCGDLTMFPGPSGAFGRMLGQASRSIAHARCTCNRAPSLHREDREILSRNSGETWLGPVACPW